MSASEATARMQLRFRPLAAGAVGGRGFHADCRRPVRGSTERQRRDVVRLSSSGKEGPEGETPDEARRRLAELDALLEGLTEPKMRPPAPPPPLDPFLDREVMKRGGLEVDMPEFSPTYVAFSMFGLVILTIFTNVVFNLYIKPSVDDVDEPVRAERVAMVNPADRLSE